MKEMNRTNFRPRQLDYSKPIQLIDDIYEVFKKDDNPSLPSIPITSIEDKKDQKNTSEQEIKRIIELFDKKKTIVIPKVERIEKKEKSSIQNGEGKFSIIQNYSQIVFDRPKHYIVHSQKNILEPNLKDYEATIHDMNFLKYENSITLDELEKIITELENDINKGEMIPQDRIKEIILRIIPEKKNHIDKILKYWLTRRDIFKKSLVRKFWKDQKFNDKYLGTTFRRRDREKMKTRRNKKNEAECLLKLKEIRDSTQKQLMNLINFAKERENTKKNLLYIQQYEFEADIGQLKQVDDKWKEFSKHLPKTSKTLSLLSSSPGKENIHQASRIHYMDNHPIPIRNKQSLNKEENIVHAQADLTNSTICSNQDQIHQKNRKIRPKPIKLIQSGSQNNIDKEKEDSETVGCILKNRIRINRYNQIVIDRYIESESSFSPFGDSINQLINKNKLYNEDFVIVSQKRRNFDKFYEDFIKDKYNCLEYLTDSDDDNNFFSQVRNISSGFKQFLKQKRSYNE